MKYKGRIHHGFQDLAGWQGSGERQGSMEMTAYNFIVADSEFLEILLGDGSNMKTTEKLYGILNQAKELGVVKYKEKIDPGREISSSRRRSLRSQKGRESKPSMNPGT